MTNGNDDEENDNDLTRIEDISEFQHTEDSEIDVKFNNFEINSISKNIPDEENEHPPELPENATEEFPVFDAQDSLETNTDDSSFLLNEEVEIENNDFSLDDPKEIQDLTSKQELHEEFLPPPPEKISKDNLVVQPKPEKFEEVKNFAQNFSYGQIQGGGNPPFSIIIRNIKYSEDAENILTILREFELATDQNANDIAKSLEYGSLLIPQISEYCAIILAHKFRRFDCDLEVGLSDEIHPSKSGDINPRGLVKKESIRQNIAESFYKNNMTPNSHDIIVTTMPTIEGHIINKYLGAETSFAIIDEDELKRLNFAQKTSRQHKSIEDNLDTSISISDEKIFKDYQKSFDLLFTDLSDQLKAKAIKINANALLGLNYQLAALPFEKINYGKNFYQLTCTATLAVISEK